MRKILILALAGAALAGCANDRDRQFAALRCQEVGITASSVEYGLCTQAYMRQAREGTLEGNYHLLTAPAPNINYMAKSEAGVYGPNYP